jgi:flavin reductase (DIM6/NTAB) family NADH-FMN oxidoreductase RutF
VTIHTSHPFAADEPDNVRRFRGRLGGVVTLWTAGSAERQAGLTVSSLMVANGEPARLFALLDPDADLRELLADTGRAVVQVLTWADRGLAEVFAGTAPAPGGAFRQVEFVASSWGPRLASATTFAHVALEAEQEAGWSVLVSCRLEEATVGEEDGPVLGHRRGRFFQLGSGM